MHYFITFMPLLVVPIAWLLSAGAGAVNKALSSKNSSWKGALAVALAALFVSMPGLVSMGETIKASVNYQAYNEKPIVAYVAENTDEDDLVQVIGDVTLNYEAKRLPASKHIHFAAGLFSEESMRGFADDISGGILENYPKLVIFSDAQVYNNFSAYVTDSAEFEAFLSENYVQVAGYTGYLAYELKA
jgi:hypothetical protein